VQSGEGQLERAISASVDNEQPLQQIGWNKPHLHNRSLYLQIGTNLADMYPGTFYHNPTNTRSTCGSATAAIPIRLTG